MLDLLPESVWNSKTRFLDICCKSGNFLVEIYNRLDRILSSDNNFKDPVKRRKHILENQIYGICTDSFEEMMVKRRMLGDPFSDNENISTIAYVHPVSGASKQFRELAQLSKQKTLEKRKEQLGYLKDAIKEKFKQMDFDVVVGNPPYNNDMYLDFVMTGHTLAKQFTLMITPAKWQAKGGGQNDLFRKTIVPYMSKIVYYPEQTDLFDIQESDGITYYLLDAKEDPYTSIRNSSDDIKAFNSEATYNRNAILSIQLLNQANQIIDKTSKHLKLNINQNIKLKQFCVAEARMFGWGTERVKSGVRFKSCKCYTNELKYNVISLPTIIKHEDIDTLAKVRVITFTQDSEEECKSYVSYMESKFVKFLMLSGRVGSMTGREAKRFVPDPGAFDHIFTDEELYKKYNLTDDEIKLIESVIKERK